MKKNLLLAVCMAGVMVSFVSEAFGQSLPVYDTPDRSKIPAFPGADGAAEPGGEDQTGDQERREEPETGLFTGSCGEKK